MQKRPNFNIVVIAGNLLFTAWTLPFLYAQEVKDSIVVNGDTVEYLTEKKEVAAVGNVEVIYKGARLTCDKLIVNTETKEAEALGNARLEDEKGTIQGTKIVYNFQNKTGTILDADFKSNPYFGQAEEIVRVSEAEFLIRKGYLTTCSYDQPHYRVKTERVNFFPQDKVLTQNNIMYIGTLPVLCLPQYNHSLREPLMHVQLAPGVKKEWGLFLLSAYRYKLSENISGRIYLDYRSKLGLGEGLGLNYASPNFGKGNFKYYYAYENDQRQPVGAASKFQRYLIRLRHKWDIDETTNLTAEYYKITDAKRMVLGNKYNILKDYFWREYEKDSQPLSYLFWHHAASRWAVDFLLQKRTNRWYAQTEKLPEIKYSLPAYQIANTPLYFDNLTSLANLNKKNAVPADSSSDVSTNRFDTTNKFFWPFKLNFVNLTPYISSRQTYYDRDINGKSLSMRSIFYAGFDASTKFYRIFKVRKSFLGMDIDGLRHIITPTIGYTYNHQPTILSLRLKQLDSVDAIDANNSVALGLSNKLQTRRKGQSVDLLDFRITTNYIFYNYEASTHNKSGANFSDFLFKLKLLPYAWMRMDLEATFRPQGDYFTEVNPSVTFNFRKDRSISLAHRYQRKGAKEFSFESNWRLNPKWKFGFYGRYQSANVSTSAKGLVEQQYTISRDLHCWEMDFVYNSKKNQGSTIWFIFRLKAFPELEFNFNQSYHAPQSGAQTQ